MRSTSTMFLGIGLTLLIARPAWAADKCTIMYGVDAKFTVSDTDLKKGDTTVSGIRGSLLVEYGANEGGQVVDGKVRVLHFSMYEHFKIQSVATITTAIHHFAPACNGSTEPTWRRVADQGFPLECKYRGNKRPVAVGFLSQRAGRIEWAKCKSASSYWSSERQAYRFADKSKGKGCLNDLHSVGNIHCDGRLVCRWGGLNRGDNPQFDVWNQPLVHGPPGGAHFVTISPDLSKITTPVNRSDGHQSYNLPNDAPSRTWFSFVGARDNSSPFTTCR